MVKLVIWDAIVPIITTLQCDNFQCIRKNKQFFFYSSFFEFMIVPLKTSLHRFRWWMDKMPLFRKDIFRCIFVNEKFIFW